MIAQHNTDITFDTINFEGEVGHIVVGPMLFVEGTFTRSNGSISARVYERLTKASRRKQGQWDSLPTIERAYRQGVYDGLKALQEEL